MNKANLMKAPLVLIAMTAFTGCAEMAVLTGAALSGAGLADGDVETAALGGILYEAGMQQIAGEDVDIEKSVNAGMQMGTAADLGSGDLAITTLTRGATDPFGVGSSASGLANITGRSGTTSPQASANSSDSDCYPIPNACQQAGDRAMQFVEQVERDGFGVGITGAASTMACVAMVGIEVNSFCASVYAAEGRNHCASLANQQAEEFRKTLASAEEAVDAVSITGIRNKCSFE